MGSHTATPQQLATREESIRIAPAMMAQLQAFHITPADIADWAAELSLTLPTHPTTGELQLSPAYVNLLKNIKKHLALGKSLADIQPLLAVPEDLAAMAPSTAAITKPAVHVSTPEPLRLNERRMNAIASLNNTAGGLGQPLGGAVGTSHLSITELLERTLKEKDDLQGRLSETEKLNSHLYNANNLYHRKVRQLTEQLAQVEHQESRYFKLLDDKSRLQAQLLEAEKHTQGIRQQLTEALSQQQQQRTELEATIERLERQIRYLQSEVGSQAVDTVTGHLPSSDDLFIGVWDETATLMEVRYDHYGIELDADRKRTFRISTPPTLVGAMGMLTTQYAYENNPSWHRQETLILSPNGGDRLEGVLEMVFWMNETPMACVIYQVVSQRTA